MADSKFPVSDFFFSRVSAQVNMSLIKVLLFAIYAVYIFLVWFLKEDLKAILLVSMPLREMYSPGITGILIFYFVPLLLGYLAGRPIKKKGFNPSVPASLFWPLFLSLLFMLPILIVFLGEIQNDSYLFIALGYSLLLIPIMFVTGSQVSSLGDKWSIDREEPKIVKSPVMKYLPAIIAALFVALLNAIPVLLSEYPVGNDIWSHASVSEIIAQGKSPFQNPYFYERAQYYTPLVHFMVAKVSQVTEMSILDLWRIYPIPLSAIFILLFFTLSLKLTKNDKSAFLATLFIIPWFSILWMDPSPRLFALCMLLLMLLFCLKGLKGNRKYCILSGISFLAIVLSHLEIAAHAIIIIIVMIILAKYYDKVTGIIGFLAGKGKSGQAEYTWRIDEAGYLHGAENKFCIILLIYVAIIVYFVTLGTTRHPAIVTTIGEIGLSLVVPMGSVSFIPFLFGIPALLAVLKNRKPENILLVSVAFLIISILFFFTLLWQFYHRYFAEVAYIALAILAAMAISKSLTKSKGVAIAITASVGLLLFASILPRMDNMLNYAPSIQRQVNSRLEILHDIEKLDEGAVILTAPEDIINRYIPLLTKKYIFSSRTQPTRELQWAVVNDLAVMASEKKDSENRLVLGNDFFQDPGILDEIRKNYSVTHILATEKDYLRLNLESTNKLGLISKNDGYLLLEIKG